MWKNVERETLNVARLFRLCLLRVVVLLRRHVDGILARHGVLETPDGLAQAGTDISEAVRAEDQDTITRITPSSGNPKPNMPLLLAEQTASAQPQPVTSTGMRQWNLSNIRRSYHVAVTRIASPTARALSIEKACRSHQRANVCPRPSAPLLPRSPAPPHVYGTRSSPWRRVIRILSRYSRKGMAYFRETPKRSFRAATLMEGRLRKCSRTRSAGPGGYPCG